MKKRALIPVIVAVILMLGLGSSYVFAGGGNFFQVAVGPVDVVEPIVFALSADSPPLPVPGAKLEPGDSFTVRENLSNSSTKRGYWVNPTNISWGGENTQLLQVEIVVKSAGEVLLNPLYIPASTRKVVEITVRIREDSPAVTGVTFYFGPPDSD